MTLHTTTPASISVGSAAVSRIPEIMLSDSTPTALLPDWRPELLKPGATLPFPESWDRRGTNLLLSIHTWLVQTPRHTILIDTGAGNEKRRPFFPILDGLQSPYLERLQAAGVMPGDVDLVLLTHIHVDHVGWNTQLVDGRWKPTFPNARYLMPQRGHEYFTSAAGRADRRYAMYEDSILPLLEAKQAEFVNTSGVEVADGLRYIATPGHSVDHMSIGMSSAGQEALFGGDVMHHPLQVLHPHLNSVYCEAAEQARHSRRRVLEYVAERKAIYFSSHFPESSAGLIRRQGDAFEWSYLV